MKRSGLWWRSAGRFGSGACGLLLCVLSAAAQEEIALPSNATPAEQEQAAEQQMMAVEQPLIGPGETTAPPVEAEPSVEVPTQGTGYSSAPRRFHYKLDAQVRAVHDDNINLNDTNRTSDFYTSLEPRVIIGLGDIENRDDNFLRLEYAPNVLLYANHSENDAFQQAGRFEGQYRFERLRIRLFQDIQIIDSAEIGYRSSLDEVNNHLNLDISGRTRLDVFTTNLVAEYDLSSKTFLSFDATNSVNHYVNSNLLDAQSIGGDLYLNYRYSTKLVIGLGGGGGTEFVDPPTPNQTFEQASMRVEYELLSKLRLNAAGGVEVRQFGGEGRGQYVSPVVQLGASYQPFPGTEIKLDVRRRTQSSASLAGQDYSSTSVDVAARQQLFRRFVVGLSVGYENAGYFNAVSGINSQREDNYYYVAPSADMLLTRYWSVGAYFLHRRNDTNSGFGFSDTQIGVRTAVAF